MMEKITWLAVFTALVVKLQDLFLEPATPEPEPSYRTGRLRFERLYIWMPFWHRRPRRPRAS